MNKLNLLSLILFFLCLSSCKVYLTPAILGHNEGYMPRPLVSDSLHSKTYVNAAFGTSITTEKSINFEMGMINISRAHTYRSINFSYGLMGYLGTAKYNNTEIPLISPTSSSSQLPNFSKISSGLGIKTTIGFHDVSDQGNTDYRLLNWENSISTEMGSYTAYRRQLTSGTYDDAYASKMKTVWTTGISSEIAWHPKKNKDFTHAFRLFLGWTPNLVSSFDDGSSTTPLTNYSEGKPVNRASIAYSYFLQFKRMHFTYEAASNVNFNFANTISLGYSF